MRLLCSARTRPQPGARLDHASTPRPAVGASLAWNAVMSMLGDLDRPRCRAASGRRSREGAIVGIISVDLFITLDGVYQAPGGPEEDREGGFEFGGWQAPYFDDESGEAIGAGIERMDALLLGRKTYDIFAASGRTGVTTTRSRRLSTRCRSSSCRARSPTRRGRARPRCRMPRTCAR